MWSLPCWNVECLDLLQATAAAMSSVECNIGPIVYQRPCFVSVLLGLWLFELPLQGCSLGEELWFFPFLYVKYELCSHIETGWMMSQ